MIRYQLALLAHSQRYLPPLLAFLVVQGVLYSDPGGAPTPEFAVSSGAVLVLACWLTIALVDAEDPVQRLITLTHARRASRVIGGVVAAVLTLCLPLTVLSLVMSIVVHHGDPARVLGLGLVAHVACALTGVALGLPSSRLLVPRIGYTVLIAVAALILVLRAGWLPLVNPMLRALTNNGFGWGPVLAGLLASAITLAVSATALTLLLGRRA